ncbi:CHK1_3 [Blepharisma stoltei]|uniref:PDEase domain-containing protein n=1 Tax=Blepharisma stoltei TaxID=1481888 RepID=A0AAU9JA94_9CILI|nr:unnamed protein product [Blepharisma stoltei]
MDLQPTSDKQAIESVFYSQTNHSIYSLLGHEEHENISLPINPNFLTYKDAALNKLYAESLYLDKRDSKYLSKEFKNNLLTFYIFITSYIIISVATWSLLYYDNKMCQIHFIVRITMLAIILFLSYAILFGILMNHNLIYYAQRFYAGLGLFIMLYLILCEENILSGITGCGYAQSTQSHVLAMACFITLLRIVTFDNFFSIAIIAFFSLILLLGCFVAFSAISIIALLSDFFILLVFLVLQLVESRQSEFRAKQLFWRKSKEEQAMSSGPVIFEKENKLNSQETFFEPQIEAIFKTLDKIKTNIKAASIVIIFSDVKNKLKRAIYEIEKIKRKLVHGKLFIQTDIQNNKNMDEEDLTFILENFVDRGHGELQRVTVRRKTMSEIIEKKPTLVGYSSPDLERILSGVGTNWNFDIWFVYQMTGSSVSIISKYLLQKWGINELFSIPEPVSDSFFKNLENSYNKEIPYHNACHAADVLHSLLYFLTQSGLLLSLSTLETFSAMIAALGHDAGHPGLTTRFLINSGHELAINYNDFRVLEMMHAAKIFNIMKESDNNVLKHLSSDDWLKSRKLIIEMILHTDMTMHFEALGKFNSRVALGDLSLENHEDKFLILSMGLKCADLGHSAKVQLLHEKWSFLLIEEFFKQGDIEKERVMQVSMYCDRSTCDINKSQAGFIKNICIPLFESWCRFLKCDIINASCYSQLNENCKNWEDKAIKHRPNSTIPYDFQSSDGSIINLRTITKDPPKNSF